MTNRSDSTPNLVSAPLRHWLLQLVSSFISESARCQGKPKTPDASYIEIMIPPLWFSLIFNQKMGAFPSNLPTELLYITSG